MAAPAKDALALSAPPPGRGVLLRARRRSLVGEVEVANRGGEALVLPDAELRFAGEAYAAAPQELRARLGRRLPPRHTAVLRLLFRGPLPPPGEHRAELRIGAASCTVAVMVPERIRLRLDPRIVYFPIGRARTLETEVLVTNRGNTPLALGPFRVAAQLSPQDFNCRAARRALKAIDEHPASMEQVVGQVACALREVLEEPGILRVENRSAEALLAPGETGVLSLRLTRPDKPLRDARSFASVAFYNTRLHVMLLPAGYGGKEGEEL